ncbi:FGGY-family carbohydrate kinase [Novosphingobium lentum]|uniref:FGGY-family carbohydrate kinase n=1 Tax=Novosphingobium lentum TaxID=145287 RepID=UPI00082E3577|nr:FGGY family carbohydrate kinase [Novosphingobium lentum]
MEDGLIVVLDVGKTLAKLTVWTRAGDVVARETRPNRRIDTGAYIALDVDGIEAWLGETLSAFARLDRIDALVPVGHGAAACIVRDGVLALPPLDYEQPIPAAMASAHAAMRDPFAFTGSPLLPDGLNLATQLHWLQTLHPQAFDDATRILLWPQYWAWRLSGVMASELTSLGCHSDVWRPADATPSDYAQAMGWDRMLPPLRGAGDVLGPIAAEWTACSGLPATTAIHCGLHDSNAALLAARGFAEIAGDEATVLSTGTWFVAMRTPGDGAEADIAVLPAHRDCLVNIDAAGRMIPSARFMGGREIEVLTGLDSRRIDIKPDQPALLAAVAEVVAAGAMILPTFAPGFGPFPDSRGRWIAMPTDEYARRAAVSLYAALVADVSLGLVGASGRVLVEGRFAEAEVFVRALASLRPDVAIYASNAHNDVSYGALRLLNPALRPAEPLQRIAPLEVDVTGYRDAWHRELVRLEPAA